MTSKSGNKDCFMSANQTYIEISISQQLLDLYRDNKLFKTYSIATAKNGIGQQEGSECTPLGKHRIAEKIGSNAPINAVFIARQWQQQEIFSEKLSQQQPTRDWILTRILWLDGLEEGFNLGVMASNNTKATEVSCDTKSRYIYIHGCPDSHAMQIPSSHGCIKMRNTDIVSLFDLVDVDTKVQILE